MIYKRHHSIDVTLQDYIEHFGSLSNAKASCFNVGAGIWQHDAWTNIDLPPQSAEFAKIQAPCIFHDLVQDNDLPILDNSAELIYTSHVIEHLPDVYAKRLFESAHKAMKPWGIFRVVTGPDANTDFAALRRNDKNWWYFYVDADYSHAIMDHGPISLADKWLLHFATPRSVYSKTPCSRKYNTKEVDALIEKYLEDSVRLRNTFTEGLDFNINYPGDHLSWWSAEKLVHHLREAGFGLVEMSAYGQSRSKFMRDLSHFDTTYPQISLYVEAIKL